MTHEQRELKQLIGNGTYVIDERSIARRILARADARTVAARGWIQRDAKALPGRPLHVRRPLH